MNALSPILSRYRRVAVSVTLAFGLGSTVGPTASVAQTAAGETGPETSLDSKAAGVSEERKNLLLITVDTLRPDALGWIDPSRKTPEIDALAKEGFRFPAAVAPVPLTLPSHASLLTGLEPDEHGVHDNAQILANDFETLAETLQAEGYSTAGFISGYPLSEVFGIAQGFEHFDDRVAEGQGAWLERRAPETTSAALEWLASAPSPWFLWIHYYDPHLPYEPPAELVGPGARGRYDGEVRLVDREIGRLRRSPQLGAGQTLTLFTADHGESLGEHGEASHGFFIYESTMRVPAIVHLPGRVAPGESNLPVRIVDMAPTALEILGIAAPTPIDGVSLTALMAGERVTVPPASIESVQPWASYGWAPLRGIRKGPWKYIAAPTPELYNVDSDPSEARNLAPTEEAMAAELRALAGSPEMAVQTSSPDALDPEVAARLRSLGYVSGGNSATNLPTDLRDPKDGLALRALLTEADQAIEKGDLRRAVELCDKVLAEDPKNRFALSRSAFALLRAGFADRAVLRLRRVIELDPDQSESRTLLAEALTRMGSFPEAIAEWQELVARRPGDATLWSQLGSTFGMAGRTDDAVAALQESLDREPESLDRQLRLAFAHFANGDANLAANRLLQVRDRAGGAFQHYGALGAFLLQAERPTEAIQALENSLPPHGDYAEGRYEWALWASKNGDEAAARKALAEALVAQPALRSKASADPSLVALLP